MSAKSPKQELNVIANPQYEQKQKPEPKKQPKMQKSQPIIAQQKIQNSSQLPYPSPAPKKREQLKKVQDEIEVMKNKILLLKIQLQKEQQNVKMNKSRTEQVIRKKINVNKIQKYKVKDTSADLQRAELLRARNASLRQSHQNQMQNIFKAIYLVKLDDARQIKNLSQSHRKKILQMNEATYAEQLERKKKVAEEHQKAKERYERYWKQKLVSVYEGENKAKQQVERVINEKKDQLKELRQQEIKLLESMNKIQVKQMEAKKQYLAALSLPVKDVAQALNRSKSSLDPNFSKQKAQFKLNRMSSQISKTKHGEHTQLTHNLSSLSSLDQSLLKSNPEYDKYKHLKVPNSTVNKEKLKIILKELKRLEKKEKESSQIA